MGSRMARVVASIAMPVARGVLRLTWSLLRTTTSCTLSATKKVFSLAMETVKMHVGTPILKVSRTDRLRSSLKSRFFTVADNLGIVEQESPNAVSRPKSSTSEPLSDANVRLSTEQYTEDEFEQEVRLNSEQERVQEAQELEQEAPPEREEQDELQEQNKVVSEEIVVTLRDHEELEELEEQQEEKLEEVSAVEDSDGDDDRPANGTMTLQRLRARMLGEANALRRAVSDVRQAHPGVRFSVRVDREPAYVMLFGRDISSACAALTARVQLDVEQSIEDFFAIHFTMRRPEDLPQDEALSDALLENEWVDVRSSERIAEVCDEHRTGPLQAPESVFRRRLRDMISDDMHVFMDSNPYASWGRDDVRIDFVGLLPEAWDTAMELVLSCEARGVYLSRRFEALFWSHGRLRKRLEDQVSCALSHLKGSAVQCSAGFGLVGEDVSSFEDLAANISAVVSGGVPPGWHRLEWMPHGAGAVAHFTYS